MKKRKFDLSSPTSIQFVLKTSYLSVIGLFLLDFYFYYGFLKNYLFSPAILASIAILAHFLVVKESKQKLSSNFVNFNFLILAPISLILTLIAYYLEEYGLLYSNYFFYNFRFHYVSLPLLIIPALGFGFVHSTKEFWIASWKKLVLMTSLFLVVGAGFLFYFDNDIYTLLTMEDGFVEYLTAVMFLFSGIISFSLIKKRQIFSTNLEKKLFYVGCVIVGLSMLFIAGEEISWGQRILGIQTPENIAEINRQGEINLHNTEFFWPFVYYSYALIGIYGMTMWILEWATRNVISLKPKHLIWKKILIPGSHLFVLFGIITLYVWLRKMNGPWQYQPWEEFAELLLIIGIFIHFMEIYFEMRRKNLKKSS